MDLLFFHAGSVVYSKVKLMFASQFVKLFLKYF